MKKALILIAPGFEECEAICVYDVLKRGGVECTLLSVSERTAESSHSLKIVTDGVLSEKALEEDWSVVFLPGGMPGAKNLYGSDNVRRILKKQNEKAGLIAAICASPAVVLAPLGLLEGRKATCYPGCGAYCPEFAFSDEGVVVSGNIVSAKSAGWAFDLGLTVLSLLCGDGERTKIRKEIFYKEGSEE